MENQEIIEETNHNHKNSTELESKDNINTTDGRGGEEEEGDDDSEELQLSASALAALQEFYTEQNIPKVHEVLVVNNSNGQDLLDQDMIDSSAKDLLLDMDMGSAFPEDWQMSQFWYDQGTSLKLAQVAISLLGGGRSGTIACISCPSAYHAIRGLFKADNTLSSSSEAHLYEYDKRFTAFGSTFVFYDYHEPHNLPPHLLHSYSVIIADPPFLSEECLKKMSQTIKLLMKSEETKIILCTGSVMEKLAEELLGLKKSTFIPKHKNNLGNEFSCFTNFNFI